MATKRKLSEMESVHPSRQAQVPITTSKPRKKPRKLGPQLHKKPETLTSVNAIKKRIRDVKRRLERSENLSANIRVENERALVAYQQDLAAAEEEKAKQKMISKYHMVRFFERQKASRQVKKLRKRLLVAKSTEEVEKIKAQMHIAEVDLNYTHYYPLNIRYVSLYPQKNNIVDKDSDPDVGADGPATKPPMWEQVEKCMIDDTLDQLRNGRKIKAEEAPKLRKLHLQRSETGQALARPLQKLQTSGTSAKHPKTSQNHSSRAIRQSNSRASIENKKMGATIGSDAGDESDGGFFDE